MYNNLTVDDERLLFSSLRGLSDLNDSQKTHFLRTYFDEKKEREKKERLIKALSHGLIAALNIYTASLQTQESVKNTLYFVGGVNLLACISFTF